MTLGWGNLAGGVGEVIGKLSTYIPGKIEKLKNEKAKLEEDKSEIEKIRMDINNPDHRKKAIRLNDIINRIKYINRVLANKATD